LLEKCNHIQASKSYQDQCSEEHEYIVKNYEMSMMFIKNRVKLVKRSRKRESTKIPDIGSYQRV
jgi:hypothetical protein